MGSLRRKTIHGNLVRVFGIGVLLIGESGAGKTRCSMLLLEKGHCLVADDVVELTAVKNGLAGKAPKGFYGIVNLRDYGILDLRRTFCSSLFPVNSAVNIVVEFQDGHYAQEAGKETELLGISVPRFNVKARRIEEFVDFIENAVRSIAASQVNVTV